MVTLEEQSELFDNRVLLAKVRAACFQIADIIENESPMVSNHQDRLKWATKLRRDPNDVIPLQVLKLLVSSESAETGPTILAFSDTDIKTKCDALVHLVEP